MLEYKPHPYQKEAIQHLLEHPKSALFLDMGLGKSSITLSAVEYLINSLESSKVLIVAPKRVASHTWSAEVSKWRNFQSLTVSRIIGNEKQRIAALKTPADIYTISRDMIAWLVHYCIKNYKRWIFDILVLDEMSSFKNHGSMRFKAIKKIAPLTPRLIGLTGTPTPNGLLSMFATMYLLDEGKRLGRTFTEYTNRYFTAGARNGHIIYQHVLKPGADKQIHDAIKDICLSMKAKDYLDLPDRIDVFQEVELSSYERYQEFKKTEVLMLGEDYMLTPVSAPALYSKLLQYCNGAVKTENDKYEVVDDTKLDELLEIIEALDGKPVFVIYQFIADYERIIAKCKAAKKISTDQDIDDFNAGKIAVGLAQIGSLAYGINMQEACCHIVHFGLSWNLELYQQVIARIHRQGQTQKVINTHLIAKGSIEELVKARLEDKAMTQDVLFEALKRHLY